MCTENQGFTEDKSFASHTRFFLPGRFGGARSSSAIIGEGSSEFLPTGPHFLGLVIRDAEFNRLFHIKF